MVGEIDYHGIFVAKSVYDASYYGIVVQGGVVIVRNLLFFGLTNPGFACLYVRRLEVCLALVSVFAIKMLTHKVINNKLLARFFIFGQSFVNIIYVWTVIFKKSVAFCVKDIPVYHIRIEHTADTHIRIFADCLVVIVIDIPSRLFHQQRQIGILPPVFAGRQIVKVKDIYQRSGGEIGGRGDIGEYIK